MPAHESNTYHHRWRWQFVAYVACGVLALVASHWFAAQTLKVLQSVIPGGADSREGLLFAGSLILFVIAFWLYRHRHHQVRQLDLGQAGLGLLVLLGGQWMALTGEHCLEHWIKHGLHQTRPEVSLGVVALALYLVSAVGVLRLRARFQRLQDRTPDARRVIAR